MRTVAHCATMTTTSQTSPHSVLGKTPHDAKEPVYNVVPASTNAKTKAIVENPKIAIIGHCRFPRLSPLANFADVVFKICIHVEWRHDPPQPIGIVDACDALV